MPLFDEDLEAAEGPPETVVKLKGIMLVHDGLLIASPEYNSSITPPLEEHHRLGVPGRQRRQGAGRVSVVR